MQSRKETVRAFTVNWKLCTNCKKVMLISFYKDEKTTQKFYLTDYHFPRSDKVRHTKS